LEDVCLNEESNMKKTLCVMVSLALVASAAFANGGQQGGSFPTKPVTCIIPYAPGGGSDTLTRAVMKSIKLPNGQPLVGTNIEGAAGFTGAMNLANKAPDGYNIMTHNPADLLAYALSGQDSMPLYSTIETVALVVSDYNLVCTNKTVATKNGWKTIEDVVAWVKANPNEKLRWGTVGEKTINMIDTKRIAQALGIADNIIFVPYDGGSNSRTASLANEIQLETCTASEIPGVVASGDNIPLLVVNGTRIKSYPTVPSTVEKGIQVSTAKPRGYFAPKGTDPAVLKALSDALKSVSQDPEFVTLMEDNLKFDVNYVDGPEAKAMMVSWFTELKPYYDAIK
jgi:tripartite-type tricarboxylate transporter receptor subunit TctC